ncbi:MAG TPA: hypothetical protein VGS80_04175 [Ktedonobacterales bacterium]|nr:hypothetical protein [Ktedonobacterales bacterium]
MVGTRLPNLTEHAVDAEAVWTRLTIPRWYGERNRPIAVRSQTAVWYSSGFPPVPIRWVLIRDLRGHSATQALLCSELDADPLHIVSWFILRWQLAVTFHEVRAHLGVETQRQWSERAILRAILRTTPALMGLFSVVTLLAHAHLSATPSGRRPAASDGMVC